MCRLLVMKSCMVKIMLLNQNGTPSVTANPAYMVRILLL